MMAFSGIVTQAALGHPNLPYVYTEGPTDSRSRHEYATQCRPFGGCAPPLFTLESAFHDPTPMVVNSHAAALDMYAVTTRVCLCRGVKFHRVPIKKTRKT